MNILERLQCQYAICMVGCVYSWPRAGATGLYMATRSSPTSEFGTPTPLQAINATGEATGPTFTGGGLTMYYALFPPGKTTADIYVTRRASKAAAFPAGTSWISQDGCMVLLQSDRAGSATLQDIYQAVRPL